MSKQSKARKLLAERAIREAERKLVGRALREAANNFEGETSRVLLGIADILINTTTEQFVIQGLGIILDEIIDEDVAAGRAERITIRGKPGVRLLKPAAKGRKR